MRILVTGSSGFIGRHLVTALTASGDWVAGLDKSPEYQVGSEKIHLVCDLLDKARLEGVIREVSPDAVIHLAARTDLGETRSLTGYSANIEGVQNLIHAIRATPSIKRCIYTSSQLVCSIGYIPRHDRDYCPNTLYGESKVRTEQIVREADGGAKEWCLVRPTTVWGPGMNQHYRRFFHLIAAGRYFHIGRKPLYKSYSYVGNIVAQYRQLLISPRGNIWRRTFYLADYEPIDLIAWTDAFQHALGAPAIRRLSKGVARLLAYAGDAMVTFGFPDFPFTSFRLKNILTEYRFPLDSTESVCGPLPFTVEQGVRDTVEWIRAFDK